MHFLQLLIPRHMGVSRCMWIFPQLYMGNFLGIHLGNDVEFGFLYIKMPRLPPPEGSVGSGWGWQSWEGPPITDRGYHHD